MPLLDQSGINTVAIIVQYNTNSRIVKVVLCNKLVAIHRNRYQVWVGLPKLAIDICKVMDYLYNMFHWPGTDRDVGGEFG